MHQQQQRGFSVRRTMAVVALSLLVVMSAQQACAAPVQAHDTVQSSSSQSLHTPRRVARMTPLWRIMTKPLNAYCKENMECSTSVCRGGFCRSATDAAKS